MKSHMDILGPARLQDVMQCLQVLADQPLSSESDHIKVDAKNYVDALKQQMDEMIRIDEAISTARKILRRKA